MNNRETRTSTHNTLAILIPLWLGSLTVSAMAQAQMPDAIASANEKQIVKLHAEGAQVYECKADATGKLTWAFREPIATLMLDGKTVGRHYAGPSWEYSDGSAVVGKVLTNAPGTTAKDIPWLKLEAASHRGTGILADAITVQRINTSGGRLDGACDRAGAYRSEPYSADYVFLRKS